MPPKRRRPSQRMSASVSARLEALEKDTRKPSPMVVPEVDAKDVRALLVIGVQNDFFPGGSCPVPDAEGVLPVISQLRRREWDLVILCQDWHPSNHCSFKQNHPGAKVGDIVATPRGAQVVHATHCVAGSEGADFHPHLQRRVTDVVVHMGSDPLLDTYSAFRDNPEDFETLSRLTDILLESCVTEVYAVGLPTDGAVAYTLLDARMLTTATIYLVEDGCRGQNDSAVSDSYTKFAYEGVQVITSDAVEITSIPLMAEPLPMRLPDALLPPSAPAASSGAISAASSATALAGSVAGSHSSAAFSAPGLLPSLPVHEAALLESIAAGSDSSDSGGSRAAAAAGSGGGSGGSPLLPAALPMAAPSAEHHAGELLHLVLRQQHDELVALLKRLPRGMLNAVRRPFRSNPLHFAAALDDVFVVDLLLRKGASVNAHTPDGRSALTIAADVGAEAVVRRLLAEDGCALNHQDESDGNMTALMYACRAGRRDMVALLLDKAASITLQTRYGQTAAMFAASCELPAGTDVLHMLLASEYRHTERLRMLHMPDASGWTVLHFAAKNGSLAALDTALLGSAAASLEVSAITLAGFSLLHLAAWNRRAEVVSCLLARRWRNELPKNLRCPGEGMTELDLALRQRATSCARQLALRGYHAHTLAGRAVEEFLIKMILMGDGPAGSALLHYDENELYPNELILDLTTRMKYPGTCTFTFAGYNNPVRQYMLHCATCNVELCLVCAEKCHPVDKGHKLSSLGVKLSFCNCTKRSCLALGIVDKREVEGYRYKPSPVDTKGVDMSLIGGEKEMQQVVDLLAWNSHEVWSAKKMADGWVYADRRDDKNKMHPQLKPYSMLSDGDKSWDRSAAAETIRVMLALGWRITRADDDSPAAAIAKLGIFAGMHGALGSDTPLSASTATTAPAALGVAAAAAAAAVTASPAASVAAGGGSSHAADLSGPSTPALVTSSSGPLSPKSMPPLAVEGAAPASGPATPHSALGGPTGSVLSELSRGRELLAPSSDGGSDLPGGTLDEAVLVAAYTPTPLDTSSVLLSEELVQLVEALARNTHEKWAEEKMAAGWRFAPSRLYTTDERVNPMLVPYEHLSDSERELSRSSARETVKALMCLGFSMLPSPGGLAALSLRTVAVGEVDDDARSFEALEAFRQQVFNAFLLSAARNGDPDMIDVVLTARHRSGAHINCRDEYGHTPLSLAVKRGHLPAAKLLIRLGAHLEMADSNGLTPLGMAAYLGNVRMVQLLLNAGASLIEPDSSGLTPVHHACKNGHVEAARVLLKNMATKRHMDPDFQFTLSAELLRRVEKRARSTAIFAGASYAAGAFPVPHAAAAMRASTMLPSRPGALASAPAGSDADRFYSKKSPMALAVIMAQMDLLELLISFGSNPTAADATGVSPYDRVLFEHAQAVNYQRRVEEAVLQSNRLRRAPRSSKVAPAPSSGSGGGSGGGGGGRGGMLASGFKASLRMRGTRAAGLLRLPSLRRRRGRGRSADVRDGRQELKSYARASSDSEATGSDGGTGGGTGSGGRKPALRSSSSSGSGRGLIGTLRRVATARHVDSEDRDLQLLIQGGGTAKLRTEVLEGARTRVQRAERMISLLNRSRHVQTLRTRSALSSFCRSALAYVVLVVLFALFSPAAPNYEPVSGSTYRFVTRVKTRFSRDWVAVNTTADALGWMAGPLLGSSAALDELPANVASRWRNRTQLAHSSTLGLAVPLVTGNGTVLRFNSLLGPMRLSRSEFVKTDCPARNPAKTPAGCISWSEVGETISVELPTSADAAGGVLAGVLQKNSAAWLSPLTRAVWLDVNVYNPNINLLGSLRMHVERLLVGGVHATLQLEVVSLYNRWLAPSAEFEGVLVFIAVSLALLELERVFRLGWRVFSDAWFLYEWTSVGLFLWAFTMDREVRALGDALTMSRDVASYQDLYAITSRFTSERDLCAMLMLMMAVRFIQYLRLIPVTGPVVVALLDTVTNRTVFMYIAVIVGTLCMFAVAFSAAMGHTLGFRTVPESVVSLFLLRYGQWDVLRDAPDRFVAILLFAFYVFTMLLIMLSLFTGVVISVYPKARKRSYEEWDYLITRILETDVSRRITAKHGGQLDAVFQLRNIHREQLRLLLGKDGYRFRSFGGTLWPSSRLRIGMTEKDLDTLEKEDAEEREHLLAKTGGVAPGTASTGASSPTSSTSSLVGTPKSVSTSAAASATAAGALGGRGEDELLGLVDTVDSKLSALEGMVDSREQETQAKLAELEEKMESILKLLRPKGADDEADGSADGDAEESKRKERVEGKEKTA